MKFGIAISLGILGFILSSPAEAAWKCGNTPVKWVHTADAKESPYYEGNGKRGVIYLDNRFFKRFSTQVGRFVFAHECGHAHGILDEDAADTYAWKVAKRQGWANKKLLGQLCKMLIDHSGDYARCNRFKANLGSRGTSHKRRR